MPMDLGEAFGVIAAESPALAMRFLDLEERRRRIEAAKRVFAEVGLKTSDPNILAVHGLLAAGAIGPEKAMDYIIRLRNLTLNELIAQTQFISQQLELLRLKQQEYQFERRMQLEERRLGLMESQAAMQQRESLQRGLKTVLMPFEQALNRLTELEAEVFATHGLGPRGGGSAAALARQLTAENKEFAAQLAGIRTLRGVLTAAQAKAAAIANRLIAEGKDPAAFADRIWAQAIAEVTAQFAEANYAAVANLSPKDLQEAYRIGDAFVSAAQTLGPIGDVDLGRYLANLYNTALQYTTGGALAYVPPEMRSMVFKEGVELPKRESEEPNLSPWDVFGSPAALNSLTAGEGIVATLLLWKNRAKLFKNIGRLVRKEAQPEEVKKTVQELEKLKKEGRKLGLLGAAALVPKVGGALGFLFDTEEAY